MRTSHAPPSASSSRSLLATLALAVLLPVPPLSATSQYYETTEFPVDVQPIVDFQNVQTSVYGPAVVQSYDLSRVFLYWMGGNGEGFGQRCDSVFGYSNPNTWSGWNNAYLPIPSTPRPNGRILPDESSTNSLINGLGPLFCYGAPWAWTDVSAPATKRKYRMTAPKSSNNIFDRILYGVADDTPTSTANGGIFRWTGLLRTDLTASGERLQLLRLSWREVTLGTTKYWYGFLGFYYAKSDGSIAPPGPGFGALRAELDTSFATDLPVLDLQIWVTTASGAGAWINIPTCNSGSDFRYCIPNDPLYKPRQVMFGEHPNLHFAKQGASPDYHWELWYSGSGGRTKDCGCFNSTSNNPAGFGDRILYRRVDMTQANPDLAVQTFPTDYQLQSETPGSPRCMPSDYDTGRIHGVLLEWTNARVFYSSTNDPRGSLTQCRSGDFFGQYLVRTLLKAR